MTVSYTGMDPDGTGLLTDTDHLWNCVRDILTTPLASRVMRRDYGSLLPDLLDEPKNDVTRMRCMSAAVVALTQWEPRITLSGISISYGDGGAVTAQLSGVITETMQAAETTLTLRSSSNGDS